MTDKQLKQILSEVIRKELQSDSFKESIKKTIREEYSKVILHNLYNNLKKLYVKELDEGIEAILEVFMQPTENDEIDEPEGINEKKVRSPKIENFKKKLREQNTSFYNEFKRTGTPRTTTSNHQQLSEDEQKNLARKIGLQEGIETDSYSVLDYADDLPENLTHIFKKDYKKILELANKKR